MENPGRRNGEAKTEKTRNASLKRGLRNHIEQQRRDKSGFGLIRLVIVDEWKEKGRQERKNRFEREKEKHEEIERGARGRKERDLIKTRGRAEMEERG